MKKFWLWISIGALLFCALLAGCNRPIPITPSASKGTPIPSVDAFLLTRTVLAQQIEDTLTAIAATAGASIQQTAEAPAVKTGITGQVTVGVIDSTPPPPYVATLSSESVTAEVTLVILTETTAEPIEPTTAPITLVASPEPQFTAESPAAPQATTLAGFPSPERPVLKAALLPIPEVYFLHRGEFPWCLARRFDIHPQQILWLNGFSPRQTYYAGQAVCLPQNPLPFPGQRALHPHPALYTVGFGETIYSIACFFGDVDPLQLAVVNEIEPPYRLNPGQVLTVP